VEAANRAKTINSKKKRIRVVIVCIALTLTAA
jgi:hypothetical protein